MSRRSLAIVAVLGMLQALGGCSREPAAHVVVYDFALRVPQATTHPADARSTTEGAVAGKRASLPRLDSTRGGLFLPFGSRIDYFLRLPPESRIAVEEIATSDPRAGLRISLQMEGEDEQVLADILGATGRREMTLPGKKSWPIARITFGALAQSESSAAADGILLIRPVIESVLPELAAAPGGAANRRGAPSTNVIIYMTDALRADHLGCYGYDRPTSPRIDAFAAEALLFEKVIAQAPWTTSSVSSMLTGVYPNTHHVTQPHRALPVSLATMGEILNDAGFMTAAFVTNALAGEDFGLARGFTKHRLLKADVDTTSVHQLSDRVNEEVFSWLDRREDDGRPLFLYVHTTDTHAPYTPPLEFARKFLDEKMLREVDMPEGTSLVAEPKPRPAKPSVEMLIGLYDAEIASNDHNFGAFLDGLRDRGMYEGSLIIFLSDHGEEFHEHGGWQHTKALYAESVNIPLIVKLPGATPLRRGRTRILAQQVDILPTILTFLGLDIPPQAEGRDLIAALDRGGDGRPARAFSYFERRGRKGVSVVDGDWKLIQVSPQDTPEFRRRPLPPPELYDIARDHGETVNVAAEHPEVLGYLRSMLGIHESAGTEFAAGGSDIDDELRRELKALGYLD